VNGHEADDRLGALALGELPELEARALERHVAACDVCRGELAELREAVATLPLAAQPETPPAALKAAILARAAAPIPVARSAARPRPSLAGGLAAALALALLGDVYFATRGAAGRRVAVLAPPPSPAAATRPAPASPAAAAVRAAPKTSATVPRTSDTAALRAAEGSVHRLQVQLAAARAATLRAREALAASNQSVLAERTRVSALEVALANARAPHVAAMPPSPAPGGPVDGAPGDVLAALQTGRVYAVDGVVASEAWHCTIVQPVQGNAFVLTRAPSARSGYAYRTWVLRGKTVFDAGALPPGRAETLAMPMPLAKGDVVAFSLEPDGSAHPSTPYLMSVTITQ